jgi:hypothetical protein
MCIELALSGLVWVIKFAQTLHPQAIKLKLILDLYTTSTLKAEQLRKIKKRIERFELHPKISQATSNSSKTA